MKLTSIAAVVLASLSISFAASASEAASQTEIGPYVDSRFLDSLHVDGEEIGKCSIEMSTAYDGEASNWMKAELPPTREGGGKMIYHKIWRYGDGSPASTLWMDPATFDVIEYKDESGDWVGEEAAKHFAQQCKEMRKSNEEVFGQ